MRRLQSDSCTKARKEPGCMMINVQVRTTDKTNWCKHSKIIKRLPSLTHSLTHYLASCTSFAMAATAFMIFPLVTF